VHDQEGPIGAFLRHMVPEWIMLGLDDATFGVVAVGFWMQICGFLQMPQILGPSFTPFNALRELFSRLIQKIPMAEVNLLPEGTPSAYPVKVQANGNDGAVVSGGPITSKQKKKRRSRNKKKQL